MSVYDAQFPEVVRAIEADHFEEVALAFLRAPVDSPIERQAVDALGRQVENLIGRSPPPLYERPEDPNDYAPSGFGVWLLDALFDRYVGVVFS